MDATLNERFEIVGTNSKTGSTREKIVSESPSDPTGNTVAVRDNGREPVVVKPLGELYGAGMDGTVDPQTADFLPLFLAIELAILRFDSNRRRLTDAEVKLALDAMSMNPEAPSNDDLVQRLQFALRQVLAINNYSRQEVRQAIRRIGRSVERHNEGGRGRGYLNFIRQFT